MSRNLKFENVGKSIPNKGFRTLCTFCAESFCRRSRNIPRNSLDWFPFAELDYCGTLQRKKRYSSLKTSFDVGPGVLRISCFRLLIHRFIRGWVRVVSYATLVPVFPSLVPSGLICIFVTCVVRPTIIGGEGDKPASPYVPIGCDGVFVAAPPMTI